MAFIARATIKVSTLFCVPKRSSKFFESVGKEPAAKKMFSSFQSSISFYPACQRIIKWHTGGKVSTIGRGKGDTTALHLFNLSNYSTIPAPAIPSPFLPTDSCQKRRERRSFQTGISLLTPRPNQAKPSGEEGSSPFQQVTHTQVIPTAAATDAAAVGSLTQCCPLSLFLDFPLASSLSLSPCQVR